MLASAEAAVERLGKRTVEEKHVADGLRALEPWKLDDTPLEALLRAHRKHLVEAVVLVAVGKIAAVLEREEVEREPRAQETGTKVPEEASSKQAARNEKLVVGKSISRAVLEEGYLKQERTASEQLNYAQASCLT